jgi:alkyl hydroperoxide reductase subunit AhpF
MPNNLLSAEDQAALHAQFEGLTRDVPLTLVTHESALVVPGEEVPYAREMRQIMEELAALSPRIRLTVEHVRPSDVDRLRALGVERLPALVLAPRLRYYGLPAGYEFSTLVATIMDLGREDGALKPETIAELGALKQDVHIQVFVTPS